MPNDSVKSAAIAQAAGSVAHKINNLLTGMIGFSQILLRDEKLSNDQREILDNIHKQSLRCHEVIRNFQEFIRCQESQEEVQNVTDLDARE